MSLLQYLGVPDSDMGLLGDPRAYAASQGIAGLTNAFGGLAAAFAPTTDPGHRARMLAQVGPMAQAGMAGVRQGAMQDYAGLKARQGMDRESAINDAMSGRPDDQLSEAGRQYRGLLGQLPERVRAALPLLSPEQRGEVLGRVLSAQPARQTHVIPPGGNLVNDDGRSLFTAPFAPQRPFPPQLVGNGSDGYVLFDPNAALRPPGAPAMRPPATPAMPGGAAPPLASPSLGLPAPGRPSAFAPPQMAPGDVTPAAGQQGDVMPTQAVPAAPALPPGVSQLTPPQPRYQILTDEDRRARNLPEPREGAVWVMTRDGPQLRGGAPITVNTEQRGQNALAAGLNTNAATMVRTAQEGAMVGAEAIRTANRINQLLTDGSITGLGANWRLGFERAAVALGLMDGQRVANTQQLVAELARSVLPMVEQLKGPTSDRDLEFLRDAAGGKITLDQDALRRLTGIAANYGERSIQRWNPMAEEIQRDNSIPTLTRQVYAPIQLPQPEAFPPRRETQPSPQAVVPGINGGPATPPDARPVLRYNPRTMRIE